MSRLRRWYERSRPIETPQTHQPAASPLRACFSRRDFLNATGALALATAGGPLLGRRAQAADARADLILTNANIWTADRRQPRAAAIAIAGNRILAVGSPAAVKRYAGRATRSIDLRGRFLMPGFNDSHLHLTRMASEYDHVELLGAKNVAEVLQRVRARVAQTPPGEWVQTRAQWHEALLEEGRMPTRAELDAISSSHPIYLPRGGHVAAVNSKVLELAGIGRDTPNPPGGTIMRDANGEPNGTLLETARWRIAILVKQPGPDAFRASLQKQIRDFSAVGITSLTNPLTTPYELEQLTKLHEASLLTTRIHWTVGADSADSVRQTRQRYPLGFGDDILRFSGLGEIVSDGGIEGAYLREPYNLVAGEQQDSSYRGLVLPLARNDAAFDEMFLAAIDAGYNVMTHVTGDGGLDVALSALTRVHAKKRFEHLRWVLHGCFLTDAGQLEQIKKLGLYITAQSQPYLLGAQMAKWWGKARTDRAIPMRAFLDAGIPVGGGSDAPAGIADPMVSIGWMVNRRCLGDLQLDTRWSITAEEALYSYTVGSAQTQLVDDRVGVLQPGMLADLVVLDADPLKTAPTGLGDIQVALTLMDGRAAFDRDGLLA